MVPATQIVAGGRLAAHLAERFQQAVVAQPHEYGVSLFKLLFMRITRQHHIAIIKLLKRLRGQGRERPWEPTARNRNPRRHQRSRLHEFPARNSR
jgi:hypothetical protein